MDDRALSITSTLAVWGSAVVCVVFRGQFQAGRLVRNVGLSLMVVGALLFVGGALALRRAMPSSFSPKALVTGGSYRVVRHPSYMGGAVLLPGLALLLQSTAGLLVTALLAWPAYIWSAIREERRLLDTFGEEYEAYRP